MAYVRKIETSRTKNSKPVPSYQVRWQEPARDEMGRPIPVSPTRPDGQKKQVHLKETFGSKEAAQERCDELNAQRHRTTAQSASEIRKAGDQPFGHYAAAWLESMEVRVARGQLKDRTLNDYRKLLHRYVLDRFGGQAVATITARQCEEFLAALVRQQSRQGADGVLNNRLTPATIKHAWSTFGRVLTYAMRHDAIPSNLADRVHFAGKRYTGDHDRFEHHPLTAAQVSAVSDAVSGEVDGLPAYPIYALMVDFLAYSGIRAAENAGLEVGDLAFTTPRQSRRLPHRAMRHPGTPNQGPQERAVGIEHAQVPEVAPYGAAADLARGTDAGLSRGTPPESQRADRSPVAVTEERRWIPRGRRTLRGPAGLVPAFGDGSVLRHDLPTGVGRGRSTRQRPGKRRYPGHSRSPAPRPSPYLRYDAADGWDSLHAGIKVAGTQHFHSHTRHLRRLDTRRGRRRGQQPSRANHRPD